MEVVFGLKRKMWRLWFCMLLPLMIGLDLGPVKVLGLEDDWYGYVNFADVSAWVTTYERLCSRKRFDIFREPRVETSSEDLRALREAISPIVIEDSETEKSNETLSLHIYNNVGVRRGYSLSYGFQRNKECLHAEDEDCIVFPEFGRVRALVLNAERYQKNENLNFIKDHFKIEGTERFVTIVNGGSIFERKFYEAVFLGGFHNKDPRRSSHQINGVSYPLEIYMFFVDETVPSVTLSTVLVVLVEESDRDNPHVKPLVNTVEEKLYDEERKFLNKNKGAIRRERLFHNLGYSTNYDIYKQEQQGKDDPTVDDHKPILQSTLEASSIHEPDFAAYVEAYEKMQSLEASLFFIDEDTKLVKKERTKYRKIIDGFLERKWCVMMPCTPKKHESNELHVLVFAAMYYPQRRAREKEPSYNATDEPYADDPSKKTCADYVTYIMTQSYDDYDGEDAFGYYHRIAGRLDGNEYLYSADDNTTHLDPGTPHHKAGMELATRLCEFLENYAILQDINLNSIIMRNLKFFNTTDLKGNLVPGKYQYIQEYTKLLKIGHQLNNDLYDHFFEKPWKDQHNPVAEKWDWQDDHQKRSLATNVLEFIDTKQDLAAAKNLSHSLREQVLNMVDQFHFPDEKTMREVVRFLKHGDRGNTAEYTRQNLHREFLTNFLPAQRKRRGLKELGNMEMTEEEIREAENLSPVKVLVNQAFQISWLIPHTGGYYYYEGSSPVPPCFRTQNTIVFKKPIKMSRSQIDILTRVPTSFNKKRDILSTTPILHDSHFISSLKSDFSKYQRFEEVEVKVHNQVRNQLFLGHDNVHANAVEENERLKAERNTASRLPEMKTVLLVSLWIILWWAQ